MPYSISFFFLAELAGTIAFACSGAMTAIEKKLDLLGVIVLGVTTAVGGGMMRDILLGELPPSLFLNPVYVLAAFLAVLVLFFLIRSRILAEKYLSAEAYEAILNLFDAIGLGIFTIVGIDTGIAAGYGDNLFLIIFLGVITGVGGGLLRDMMACQTPYILKKHVYACASLAGAFCYVGLLKLLPREAALSVSALLVVAIRLLARHYKWNLPVAGCSKA